MLNGYRTYISIIVAIAPSVATLFGYSLAPDFGEKFTQLAMAFMTVVSGAFALYYRAKAEVPGFLAK